MRESAHVSLRPMSDEDFVAFRESFVRAWAADLQRVQGMRGAEALRRCARSVDEALPAGPATPGRLLFVVVVGAGEAVGALWLEIEDDGHAHIADVAIDPPHRGRGYGRRALELAEEEAMRAGATAMTLNVYADNERARGLYTRLGYEPTRISMRKALGTRT